MATEPEREDEEGEEEEEEEEDDDDESPPPPLLWRRLVAVLRPIRGGLAAMIGLSTAGVLIGLVPPLALGALVNALVEFNDTAEAALLAGLIALAIVAEATSYVLSDGLSARNEARLYRGLRLDMFEGVRRPEAFDDETSGGLASRFVSDVETVGVMVSVLDSGSMQIVEFVSAIVVLGLMAPWTIPAVAVLLGVTWFTTRRLQEPAAAAGHRRQEELEHLTGTINHELRAPQDAEAPGRFTRAVERLLKAEIRYGWLQAVNLQGSGGLAKLGPIAAVVVAAFTGIHHAGTLIAVYLIAQRAFWAFDGFVDLSLGLQSVRGAVARCFELVDAGRRAPSSAQVNV